MGKITRVLEKSGYFLDVESKNDSTTWVDEREQAQRDATQAKTLSGENPGDINGKDRGQLAGSSGWAERLTRVVNFSRETAESFRVLRSKILHGHGDKKAPRSIMVTSVLPQEGKSFISANLGIALAQGVDQHSLLVDCDLRLPSLARLLGVKNEFGLVDFLQSGTELGTLIQRTSIEKMSILTSGSPPVNPAELLGSMVMHDLVEELSSRYPDRFVIFDTPPLQVASESVVLSQVVDGVILVVRHGASSRPLLERVISDIGSHKIIGVIFNGHKRNFISSRFINKNYYQYGNYYGK